MMDNTPPLFSPRQILIGTLFGGILAAFYYVYLNFNNLGQEKSARVVMKIFIVTLPIIYLTLPFVADYLPTSTPFIFGLAAYMWANSFQLTKEEIKDNPKYTFFSNYKVFLSSLACISITLVLDVIITTLYEKVGFI